MIGENQNGMVRNRSKNTLISFREKNIFVVGNASDNQDGTYYRDSIHLIDLN